MTTDLPAMRRFKGSLLEATSSPLALWLSTELAPSFGKGEEWDPFVTLVADVEAEGSALIGGVQCGTDHGHERPAHPGESEPSAWLLMSACPSCGAAL